METKPLKMVVRVIGAYLTDLQTFDYRSVVKQLLEKGFALVDTSWDGLIESYSHPEYKDKTKGMWITVGLSDEITELKFTTSVIPA